MDDEFVKATKARAAEAARLTQEQAAETLTIFEGVLRKASAKIREAADDVADAIRRDINNRP